MAETFANPLWQILFMRLALLTWKRYCYKFDNCTKDEVDIDSQDFDITEHHDLEEEEEEKKKIKMQTLKQGSNQLRTNLTLHKKSSMLGNSIAGGFLKKKSGADKVFGEM